MKYESFVLLSDGKDMVLKHDGGSYRFTKCFLTQFDMNTNCDANYGYGDALVSNNTINISFEVVADGVEAGNDGIDVPDLIEKIKEMNFGEFGRDLDI